MARSSASRAFGIAGEHRVGEVLLEAPGVGLGEVARVRDRLVGGDAAHDVHADDADHRDRGQPGEHEPDDRTVRAERAGAGHAPSLAPLPRRSAGAAAATTKVQWSRRPDPCDDRRPREGVRRASCRDRPCRAARRRRPRRVRIELVVQRERGRAPTAADRRRPRRRRAAAAGGGRVDRAERQGLRVHADRAHRPERRRHGEVHQHRLGRAQLHRRRPEREQGRRGR